MSDQDAAPAETAATATGPNGEIVTVTAAGPQDAAETSSDDQDNGKPRRPASDDLKADLVKERRERQKLQSELQKLKDRDLSELEKAQRQATEASKELEQLRAESLRQRVALKAGIPAEHIHRLQGATEQELAADAAELAKLLTPKGPKPDPSQGSRGGNTNAADMNQLIRRMAGFS